MTICATCGECYQDNDLTDTDVGELCPRCNEIYVEEQGDYDPRADDAYNDPRSGQARDINRRIM
jgi:hypothetical protein